MQNEREMKKWYRVIEVEAAFDDFSTAPSDNSDLHACLGFGNCNAIKVIDFDFDFDFDFVFVGDTFKNGVGAFKGLVETLMGYGG